MMNCIPAKAFDKGDQIGDFLANSKNGVIFVSFGSVLKASLMADENILQATYYHNVPKYHHH